MRRRRLKRLKRLLQRILRRTYDFDMRHLRALRRDLEEMGFEGERLRKALRAAFKYCVHYSPEYRITGDCYRDWFRRLTENYIRSMSETPLELIVDVALRLTPLASVETISRRDVTERDLTYGLG